MRQRRLNCEKKEKDDNGEKDDRQRRRERDMVPKISRGKREKR
jgi:hypothetical protein